MYLQWEMYISVKMKSITPSNMNPSFTWRMIERPPTGHGKWEQVFKGF